MAHLTEPLERLRPHALCRGVRGPKLGISFLEGDQLSQEGVVIRIRDLRIVEYVVAVVVIIDLPPEIRGPGLRLRLRCPLALLRGHQCSGETRSFEREGSRLARSQPRSSSRRSTSVSSKWSGVTESMPSWIAAKSVPSSLWYEGSSP